jgi:tetrathionate reductase subunit B
MSEKGNGSKLSRRNFMKGLGAGSAAATLATTLPITARAAAPPHKAHYGMLIDTRRCIGCHACSVACKAEFDVPLGHTRSWVEYIEKGNHPHVTRSFLPRLCNHCRHPNCVDVCPTGATYKREEDGIVVVDPDICIGCKYCVQACPYDARFPNPVTGTADKCDFCLHRVSQGLEPACVETCIGGARIFGDLNDPQSEISRAIATNPLSVLRPGMGTEPNVYYIAADHTDEHELRRGRQHVQVTTHRKAKQRR